MNMPQEESSVTELPVVSQEERPPNRRHQEKLTLAFEIAVVLACALLVFFRRLLELEEVEVGGDALIVWEFARNLVLGGDLPSSLNHHTTRFGLVLPTMLVQWLFGVQATSYFIGPLVASTLLHVLVYLIVRKLSGPLGGVVSVLALLNFEPMVRASSQILPEAFGPMYAAFATYAALLFTEATSLRSRWLSLSLTGLGVILAYGAKEVYLFYAPGIALLVWFGGAQGPLLPERWINAPPPDAGASRLKRLFHRLKNSRLVVPAALTAVVLFLVLIETVFLVGVADAGSRLDVVSSTHGGGGEHGPRINTAGDFFALYTQAPAEWIQALTASFFAWLGVTAFCRDRRSRLVGLTLLVFFLLQTFVVRKLSPLTPWFEPHPRYLLGMVGPIAMMLGIFVGDALSALGGLLGSGRSASSSALRNRSLVLPSIALASFVGAGWSIPAEFERAGGTSRAWVRTRERAEDFTAAYEAGIPIIADTPLGKPAAAAAALFIDPAVLRHEDGGIIASKALLRPTSQKGRFLARAALLPDLSKVRLRNVVEQRARSRRCAVVLRQSVRFISGATTFGKDCISLEDELAGDPRAGMTSSRPRAGKRGASRRD